MRQEVIAPEATISVNVQLKNYAQRDFVAERRAPIFNDHSFFEMAVFANEGKVLIKLIIAKNYAYTKTVFIKTQNR